MASVVLYGLDLSHYVIKAKRILAYKGIKYDYEYAPYHDRQDLLKVSGQDYVPTLLWEEEVVLWSDIADFVEAKKPTPTLYPKGSRDLARIIESWAHNVVEEASWRVVAPDARKTFKDPREAWVFEEMQRRTRGDLDAYAKRKPEFLKGFVGTLQPVEDRLKASSFLLGDEPSLADFALYGAIHPMPYTGNDIPKELKATRKWFATVAALGSKK